jgi:hypothetical protein
LCWRTSPVNGSRRERCGWRGKAGEREGRRNGRGAVEAARGDAILEVAAVLVIDIAAVAVIELVEDLFSWRWRYKVVRTMLLWSGFGGRVRDEAATFHAKL